ncbi:unnamed protein product [Linum tenue]|uniref:Uncharacterized protein n=1 Tax=Linum tenue TaxID=586396 RepID=A0AAV0R822_9ROSI|nr:unnamed protein product [Linum tenue]
MTTTVRYKFLSSRDFSEIQIQGPYVTVGDLKLAIFKANFKDRSADPKSKSQHVWNGCCLGTDHDLSIIDPQTNTPYSDESALIFDKASVLLRRIPGDRRRQPLNTTTIDLRPAVEEVKSAEQETKSLSASDSVMTTTNSGIEDLDFDDFGGDVYAIPSQVTKPSTEKKKKKNNIAAQKKSNIAPAAVDKDEESRIKALVNTPALAKWTAATLTTTGKRKAPYSTQPPPTGYVCHRCGIKGHFIQDCPTNGDPSYDLRKRMRPMPTAPSAAAESEFNRQMEGISSFSSVTTTTSSSGSKSSGLTTVGVPAELNCPLCRGIMREAVFVKSCCFRSYCKGCISDHVKSSKSCACGARNADEGDFLPNVTVRSMIDSILQRRSCSTGSSAGSNSCCSTVVGA